MLLVILFRSCFGNGRHERRANASNYGRRSSLYVRLSQGVIFYCACSSPQNHVAIVSFADLSFVVILIFTITMDSNLAPASIRSLSEFLDASHSMECRPLMFVPSSLATVVALQLLCAAWCFVVYVGDELRGACAPGSVRRGR